MENIKLVYLHALDADTYLQYAEAKGGFVLAFCSFSKNIKVIDKNLLL